VLAHLLAARLSEVDAFFDPVIRRIVFDGVCPLPGEITVFYWVHPFAQQIIMRDCLMPAVRANPRSGFQRIGLLKYFPIGFMASDSKAYEGLNSLSPWWGEPPQRFIASLSTSPEHEMPTGLRHLPVEIFCSVAKR
jgi:hypothetical protein